MRIGIAQINPTVGDLRGNFEKILAAYERLAAAGAELVLAPELAAAWINPVRAERELGRKGRVLAGAHNHHPTRIQPRPFPVRVPARAGESIIMP